VLSQPLLPRQRGYQDADFTSGTKQSTAWPTSSPTAKQLLWKL